MKTMQETYKGIGFCLLIAIPAFLLGKQFEVIGGPVFAILIGMCLALLVKESGSLQAGIKFTSKKILQYAVILLGFGMNLIVVPQFLILSLCFYAGKWMMSYLDPAAIQNFIAVGGLMTFILGLNIAKIKEVRAANLLPALAVVFPATAFFHLLGA